MAENKNKDLFLKSTEKQVFSESKLEWESMLQNPKFMDFLAEYSDTGELDPESDGFGVEISKRLGWLAIADLLFMIFCPLMLNISISTLSLPSSVFIKIFNSEFAGLG